MSYEDALEAMRNAQVQPAPFERLQEKQAARADTMPRPAASKATIATVVAAIGFLAIVVRPAIELGESASWFLPSLHLPALLPAFILLWSLRRISRPQLGAQLVCRAVWWSNLVVGLLIAHNYGAGMDKAMGAMIAVACARALYSVGERGLDIEEPDHPFAPVRFRGHLLLALVMAAADALTLSFSALLQLRFGASGWNLMATLQYAGPTVAAAAVMGVAVWGVYRLRTWALFLNLVANIAIAYFAMEGTLNLSPSVSLTLATTAAIQSFIPVPILAAALGDRDAGQPLLSGIRTRLMTVVLVGLAVFAVLGVPMHNADGWVDGPGRAFVRGVGPTSGSVDRVRRRLDAESDDLRGRNFSGHRLRMVDFGGVDLRDATLIGAQLSQANLKHADLRGADLRRAHFGLGDGEASMFGARIEGADLTGAVTTAQFWHAFEPEDLEGVVCPDGSAASPDTGCEGKLGLYPPGYRRSFEVFGSGGRCGSTEGRATTAFTSAEPGPLWIGSDAFVRLESGVMMSRSKTIVPAGEVWTVRTFHAHPGRRSTETCEQRLIPLEPDPLSDPGASSRGRDSHPDASDPPPSRPE